MRAFPDAEAVERAGQAVDVFANLPIGLADAVLEEVPGDLVGNLVGGLVQDRSDIGQQRFAFDLALAFQPITNVGVDAVFLANPLSDNGKDCRAFFMRIVKGGLHDAGHFTQSPA